MWHGSLPLQAFTDFDRWKQQLPHADTSEFPAWVDNATGQIVLDLVFEPDHDW